VSGDEADDIEIMEADAIATNIPNLYSAIDIIECQ
jgi:hypothetical protein